jgi:hypothetical protein
VKIGLKNIIKVLILFGGSSFYFFFKAGHNTKGLIIDSIFRLNIGQANTFYFVMGCLCIFILALCGYAVYLQNKRVQKK